MTDRLAQHILIDILNRWDADLEEHVKTKKCFEAIKDNINVLLRADGLEEDRVKPLIDKPPITDMLKVFAVGTEKRKLHLPPPAAQSKVRPLCLMDL